MHAKTPTPKAPFVPSNLSRRAYPLHNRGRNRPNRSQKKKNVCKLIYTPEQASHLIKKCIFRSVKRYASGERSKTHPQGCVISSGTCNHHGTSLTRSTIPRKLQQVPTRSKQFVRYIAFITRNLKSLQNYDSQRNASSPAAIVPSFTARKKPLRSLARPE